MSVLYFQKKKSKRQRDRSDSNIIMCHRDIFVWFTPRHSAFVCGRIITCNGNVGVRTFAKSDDVWSTFIYLNNCCSNE